jgi:hypothetical protein
LPFSWPGSPRPPAVDGSQGEPPLFPYGYGLKLGDVGELPALPADDRAAPPSPAPAGR